MPYRALSLTLAITAGVAGTVWLLSAENEGSFRGLQQDTTTSVPETVSSQESAAEAKPAAPVSKPPSDNALGFMLASVADEYQQTIRYPDYSVPLTKAQAEAYQGNRYHPVVLPLEGDGRFVVTLDKFRFSQGEPILVVASLKGRQVFGQSLSATLETAVERDRVASAELENADPGYYQGTVSSDHTPGEYRLIVEARVDGKPVRHVSSLTIEPDLGSFEGLETAYVSGNDLVIPVRFDPEQSGYYALSAQLYSGEIPLAQLQQETSLGSSSAVIRLKAHGSVLANRDIQGPLQLRHLQIRRLPATPGDRTDYAFGPEEGYEFSPPDLDGLRDQPAMNPESEQRAALLRQLADKF
ncbi:MULTISPECIES: hypothetical protein [Marinobacter]|uniref:Uncharacterized protein n=2 Tax=Marinobacter nauticus TaxID=2743 RepID=A0A833JUZ3_MARNT|nr:MULTISPECIES: hypothetical protein [Marinobacter]KAE8547016.1 hypothetical protein F6453_0696 [Marinobacter nauticus]MEC9038140.1 hypothetical protein [Pseudomonadota bacterium]MEC9386739.1 hypothetical protein [Pseudomonadota bacterium]